MIETEALQFRTEQGITYVVHCDHPECCDDLELLKRELGISDIKSARYIEDNARRILLVEA
tara:strand:- start:9779 stop:9961 length:183 start_codon:yes stop_codon:yes gene_type:complete